MAKGKKNNDDDDDNDYCYQQKDDVGNISSKVSAAMDVVIPMGCNSSGGDIGGQQPKERKKANAL